MSAFLKETELALEALQQHISNKPLDPDVLTNIRTVSDNIAAHTQVSADASSKVEEITDRLVVLIDALPPRIFDGIDRRKFERQIGLTGLRKCQRNYKDRTRRVEGHLSRVATAWGADWRQDVPEGRLEDLPTDHISKALVLCAEQHPRRQAIESIEIAYTNRRAAGGRTAVFHQWTRRDLEHAAAELETRAHVAIDANIEPSAQDQQPDKRQGSRPQRVAHQLEEDPSADDQRRERRRCLRLQGVAHQSEEDPSVDDQRRDRRRGPQPQEVAQQAEDDQSGN